MEEAREDEEGVMHSREADTQTRGHDKQDNTGKEAELSAWRWLPEGARHGKAGSLWSACHCILLVSLFQSEARLRLHATTPFKINPQISM